MSYATLGMSSDEKPYEADVNALVDRFSALVKHANRVALAPSLRGFLGGRFWPGTNPLPLEVVRKLVLEPVPASQGSAHDWRLLDLTKSELEMLRRWAQANREGTDKRLLPTAVLFAILGAFANTKTFTDLIDRLLVWLSAVADAIGRRADAPLVQPGIAEIVAFWAVMLAFFSFIEVLSKLFENLVAQSVIVEACIVAEHVCDARTQWYGLGNEARAELGW